MTIDDAASEGGNTDAPPDAPGEATGQPSGPIRSRDLAWPWVALLTVVVAVTVAVSLAEPIQDGDLFWHLAYARQIVDGHTLSPDPSLYSWTPTSDAILYVAWLAEVVLYGIWRATGLTGLFVLRYVVAVGSLVFLARYAWRLGIGRRVLTFVVLTVVFLSTYVGTLIKPELFSFLLINLVVGCWFRARLGARTGGRWKPWLVAVPVLMLLWVNTHGGFVFGLLFLVAVGVGELVNARWNPDAALPAAVRRWMGWCWLAAFAVTVVNPHGVRYPLQLFGDYVLRRTDRPDQAWNAAYQSIFASTARGLFLVQLGILMLVGLGILVARAGWNRWGVVDWALVLANLVFLPFFVVYVRTTFFWPVVAGYTAFALAAQADSRDPAPVPVKRWVPVLGGVLVALLGVRTVASSVITPRNQSWVGFGTGYANPVVEADFLARERLGDRVYNIFDSGGYLLWRLYPGYRVMVDSRSYPYLDWFEEQKAFTEGRRVKQFVEKYPADVAVIDLDKQGTWQSFLDLGWRPVFYGPTAVVFVEDPDATLLDPADPRWAWAGEVRNAGSALDAFELATTIGDFRTAWTLLDRVDDALGRQRPDGDRLADARAYRRAYRALAAGDYALARGLFTTALGNRVVGEQDALVLRFLGLRDQAVARGETDVQAGIETALAKLAEPAAAAERSRAR